MGLDIWMYKCKRSDYNAYTKAHKEWEEKEPESGKISKKEFEKLPKAEQEKITEECSRWYESQPKLDDDKAPEIGYFRKVNFLMSFFDYRDDENCTYKEIDRAELEDLQERCLTISHIKPSKIEVEVSQDGRKTETKIYSEADQEKCEDLLPTQSGFFYGSTTYDEYYFDDVKEVLEWVEGVLEQLEDDEVVLMYCWF